MLNLKRTLLKGKEQSILALAEKLAVSKADVKAQIKTLKAEGHIIHVRGDRVQAVQFEAPTKPLGINVADFMNEDGWFTFGATGDNHMGSKYERMDVLNALYDVYEREGVTTVFNAGNWIDGEARFNFSDLHTYGMEAQVRYFASKYPKRPGVTTYFIGGDDHEGWYQQKLKMSIGAYAEGIAREMGREDLRYIGYMESRVVLRAPRGSAEILVMHPGGGSAYAESYTTQKIAEAFGEGEKPDVVLAGHYHKAIYGVHRGIHCLQTACTQDQTPFMRKKRLKAAVGGWIVKLHQSPNGDINRFAPEFLRFYGKEFYKARNYDTTGPRTAVTL